MNKFVDLKAGLINTILGVIIKCNSGNFIEKSLEVSNDADNRISIGPKGLFRKTGTALLSINTWEPSGCGIGSADAARQGWEF